jgi:hypothetical protein
MINPVIFDIEQHDGSKRTVIIEPVLEKSGNGVKATGSYKIYKSSIDNQSSLFTEKLEIDEKNIDIPDEINPDYLGDFSIVANGKWHYEGNLLSAKEQGQVAGYIERHQ